MQLVGSGFMNFANATTIPFLAISLRTELGMDVVSVELLLGCSTVFAVVGGVTGGTPSDSLGRVPALLLCLAGVVGSFTGLCFSHEVPMALLFNATMVLCSSASNPVAKVLLGDLLPPDRRVTWFSYQYAADNVGFVIGPRADVALGFSGARFSFLLGRVHPASRPGSGYVGG
jgi:MFS family permease